jgi:hypothetical protein
MPSIETMGIRNGMQIFRITTQYRVPTIKRHDFSYSQKVRNISMA